MTILETHSTKSQHSSKCPGIGCRDQGCPAHYANDYEALQAKCDALLEALEEMIDVDQRVDGWESFPSDPIERAEDAIQAYQKQGGDL